MRNLIAAVLLLAVFDGQAQNALQNSDAHDHPSPASVLSSLQKRAEEAHESGQVAHEIEYRQQISQIEWTASFDPHTINDYDRYNLIFLNDLPLGLLLEGIGELPEAEKTFRHNHAALASLPEAGNDIKSDNELHLAYLLAKEGNSGEAEKICSHWKNRMKGVPGRQDSAHFYGIPPSPVYDTPQVEVARWDLACGKPEEGLKLIAGQITVHPHMLVSFSILTDYYEARGEFEKAHKIELHGTSALLVR